MAPAGRWGLPAIDSLWRLWVNARPCPPPPHPSSWHITEECEGSALTFLRNIAAGGHGYLGAAYPRPSWAGLQHIAVFGAIEAAFQLFMPGKTYRGPATPQGNVPVYKVGAGRVGGWVGRLWGGWASRGGCGGAAKPPPRPLPPPCQANGVQSFLATLALFFVAWQ